MFLLSSCTVVQEISQVGHARRMAIERARALGFSETELGSVGMIVTELANNLVKHARQGSLLFRVLAEESGTGFEVLSIDRGPGMADVMRCLGDGYSTAGSPGTGLGAVNRAASFFDVYSQPDSGTVIVAQVWTKGYRASLGQSLLEIGAVSVPMAHESVSGDGWSLSSRGGRPRLVLVDGLGHGTLAAQAAAEAVRIFEQDGPEDLVELLGNIHRALTATRGAAMALLEFDPDRRLLLFAGLGNIAGRMWNRDMERNFISSHGIVGHALRPVKEYQYPWPADASIVLASDGLLSRWTLDSYPGLRLRHPALVAGVLYRDFQRGGDDITVVAVRERRRTS